jgi:hypothetical protein
VNPNRALCTDTSAPHKCYAVCTNAFKPSDIAVVSYVATHASALECPDMFNQKMIGCGYVPTNPGANNVPYMQLGYLADTTVDDCNGAFFFFFFPFFFSFLLFLSGQGP